MTTCYIWYIIFFLFYFREQFFYNFVQAGIFGWSGLLVIIMVMQVHDFDFTSALRNIALTLFTMAVIFVIAMVIYILGKAAVDFFASILEEAFNRVYV